VITDLDIEGIKTQADIAAIIGGRVALRQGHEVVALCPFHKERTPSFSVNTGKRIWKCFGCGLGGDVINFIERFDRVAFPEALRRVAGIAMENVQGNRAVGPGRFVMANRKWIPRWRFQPTGKLDDAFELLAGARPQEYQIRGDDNGTIRVEVRIGGGVHVATGTSLARALSQAAARAIAPKAGSLRARLLGFARERGVRGFTDAQAQAALEMDPSTQRPRRVELQRAALIRDSGRTRPTPSGRSAVVWVVEGADHG